MRVNQERPYNSATGDLLSDLKNLGWGDTSSFEYDENNELINGYDYTKADENNVLTFFEWKHGISVLCAKDAYLKDKVNFEISLNSYESHWVHSVESLGSPEAKRRIIGIIVDCFKVYGRFTIADFKYQYMKRYA